MIKLFLCSHIKKERRRETLWDYRGVSHFIYLHKLIITKLSSVVFQIKQIIKEHLNN